MNNHLEKIRLDFPTLNVKVHGKKLVYLDNAATTHKPYVVIDSVDNYYKNFNSNVHRGVHYLSQISTNLYENSREKIREFINARYFEEIIFTKGATESINLIANSYGREFLKEDDEIIISHMEHHSNIVPWQLLCKEKKLKLKVIPIDDEGNLNFNDYLKLLSEKTKIVSIVHISNSLGTINPINEVISEAKKFNAITIVDASQSVQHIPIHVQNLNCAFLVFSGHKLYGPTGTGILYGKKEILEEMTPYQSGGDMIKSVSFERTIFNDLPYKFEAGTPNIAGFVGLSVAVDYIRNIGFDYIIKYETELLNYATEKLSQIP